MAEFNSAEIDLTGQGLFEEIDVMVGDKDRSVQLYYQLIQGIRKAKSIDIIVSFLMESGVRMLLKDLKDAMDSGTKIRILTGNYLGITQPSALYLIKQKLGDSVDLRFYNEKDRSFHPKSYILHYEKYSDIIIGSSNISRSALTSGIEWNYRFSSTKDPVNYQKFLNTFEDLFENHSVIIDDKELKRYSKNWHRPAASKDLDKYDESEEEKDTSVRVLYEPRGAQIEALCALQNSREEGAKKALVQAATGIGKTYLAAFDSKDYKTVLFVAHRQEILDQAARSFKNVRNSEDYGFFDGKNKCTDKSVIFASVATLGKEEYLTPEFFPADKFDYIVIDEFHHAVTSQYRKIVDYFTPQFMLGLTATPDRMDGKNIYELCDYNVPYEIPLAEAINKGMLVPFHYYGIYDDTEDYSGLKLRRGVFDVEELNIKYIGNERRYDLIYKHYCKYGSGRALGFCCSRKHAEDMAKAFCKRGIPSAAVYSDSEGEYSKDRTEAIKMLKKGDIKVIFSVDMFNEGVDIPAVDMVMFLRPTESPVIFMQQLGRGLRRSKDKDYLNVLDFIGNYEKAGKVRFYLSGKDRNGVRFNVADRTQFPDDCIVDFDMQLIDLFEEMDKKQAKVKDIVNEEYLRIKDMLGIEHPSRMDLFTYMDDDVYLLAIKNAKTNPFKDYLGYLKEMGDLTFEETALCAGLGREFINVIENTNMSKVYKMPVLMAFYNHGDVRMQVSDEQLLAAWKEFFDSGNNWKDLPNVTSYAQYKSISDKEHIKKIHDMPVHFLLESGKGFFCEKEGCALALRDELWSAVDSAAFKAHFKDVIEYRAMDYYRRRYKNESEL